MGVSLGSELEIQTSVFDKKNGITALMVPSKQGLAAAIAGSCTRPAAFRNRIDAKAVIGAWRQHYNEARPLSRLGIKTPGEFARQQQSLDQPCAHFKNDLVHRNPAGR
jgi:hypothetical protein